MKLYVSDTPNSFDMSRPCSYADINDGRVTYITNDNITRKYFLLSFNDKYYRSVGARSVQMDSVQNLRDIGGYFSEHGNRMTGWGKIFRSGELKALSRNDTIRLDNLKIKTVIDLRGEDEIALAPEKYAGANIISIPIPVKGKEQITRRLEEGRIRKGDGLVYMQDTYISYVTDNSEQFGKALKVFLDKDNYPILVNCSMGKDRAGFLTAMLLTALDVPEETIMKDYMASGSFARGKEEKAASASMVFVGNINQSVDVLLKTSSLFDPFPPEMGTDTAFLDRLHCYIPGWEIPKFRPEHFTNDYGFITDYLAEFIRELRKEQYGDALDKYFRLGKNLNQRDTIAVRKIVGGYVKLLYPDGEFTKEQLEEILVFALEMRRRVKEQLKKLGGMEFYDVNFSYIDLDTFEEKFVSVPEQGGGKLIPDGMCNPGQIYTVSRGKSGMIGVFRLESQMLPGSGKFERTGLGSDRDCRESTNTAFNFLKANGTRISGGISTASKDYIINYQDLQGIGMTGKLALPTLIALCSIALGRPTVSTLAVLGEISISGTILKVDELANSLQVCLDSGAKKVLLPITSAADLGTVPPELVGSFNLIFYSSAEDAVFKALGVE